MGKSKLVLVIIAVLLALCLIAFFYPKKTVVGGMGGFLGFYEKGQEVYREDYQCFGFASTYCPKCNDCGCDHLCYGMRYDKRCSLEFLPDNMRTMTIKKDTVCR